MIYLRILQKYARPVALFYSTNHYFPRALKALLLNFQVFLYLAFMTTYVDLSEGEIETGTAVFACFLFARFSQFLFCMAAQRDGYCKDCKNYCTYFLALFFDMFMQFAVLGFFYAANFSTYDKFNQVAWAGCIFEFVFWDLCILPFIIYILALFSGKIRTALAIY